MLRTLNVAFLLVSTALLIGAATLALGELRDTSTCPDLLGIPACYIVLGCAAVAFVSRLLPDPARFRVLLVGAGPALALAAVATVLQVTGQAQCPKGPGGIPLCYLSLLLFGALVGLEAARIWLVREAHSRSRRLGAPNPVPVHSPGVTRPRP